MEAIPPGWWPDPTGRHERRYWDGVRWSGWVSDQGRVVVDPVVRRPHGVVRWFRRLPMHRQVGFWVGSSLVASAALSGVVGLVTGDDARSVGDGPVREIPVPAAREVAVGAGAVWVENERDHGLVRIDASAGSVTDQIELGGEHTVISGIAASGAAVWVGVDPETSGEPVVLARIDPTTLDVVAEVELPEVPEVNGVATGPSGVWVVTRDAQLIRIDPTTNDIVDEIPLTGGEFFSVAASDDAAWTIARGENAELRRIDPTSGEITRIDLSAGTDGDERVALDELTAGDDAVWVVRSRVAIERLSVRVDVCRVDASTELVDCAPIDVLDDVDSIAFDDGVVWVGLTGDPHRVLGLDAETLERIGEVEVPTEGFFDLAAGEGAAWVTNDQVDAASVVKIPA